MKKLIAEEYKRFEDIKQIREDGSELWSARELAVALDYIQWRNFTGVIKRAMIACENSGHDIFHDFAEVSKIVEAGATNKPVKDQICLLLDCAEWRPTKRSDCIGTDIFCNPDVSSRSSRSF